MLGDLGLLVVLIAMGALSGCVSTSKTVNNGPVTVLPAGGNAPANMPSNTSAAATGSTPYIFLAVDQSASTSNPAFRELYRRTVLGITDQIGAKYNGNAYVAAYAFPGPTNLSELFIYDKNVDPYQNLELISAIDDKVVKRQVDAKYATDYVPALQRYLDEARKTTRPTYLVLLTDGGDLGRSDKDPKTLIGLWKSISELPNNAGSWIGPINTGNETKEKVRRMASPLGDKLVIGSDTDFQARLDEFTAKL